MTEKEWLETDRIDLLLRYLEGKLYHWNQPDTAPKASNRKMRLFACACCRRIWHVLDTDCRRAVEIAESYADGLADEELLLCWRGSVMQLEDVALKPLAQVDLHLMDLGMAPIGQGEMLEEDDRYLRGCGLNPQEARALYAASWPITAVINATHQVWPKLYMHGYGYGTTQAELYVAKTLVGCFPSQTQEVPRWHNSVRREIDKHTCLLRHMVGNPFRPYPSPDAWPTSVLQPAAAIYGGEDCGFALADALEESGHAEIADHFRKEKRHPKGCWTLDAILRKE